MLFLLWSCLCFSCPFYICHCLHCHTPHIHQMPPRLFMPASHTHLLTANLSWLADLYPIGPGFTKWWLVIKGSYEPLDVARMNLQTNLLFLLTLKFFICLNLLWLLITFSYICICVSNTIFVLYFPYLELTYLFNLTFLNSNRIYSNVNCVSIWSLYASVVV